MSYDGNVRSPRTIRDTTGNPLTQTADEPELDGGIVPLTKAEYLAVDLATLVDTTAGTASDLLVHTFPLDPVTVGLVMNEWLLAIHAHATLVTVPSLLTLMVAVRDETILPTPSKDDIIAATGQNVSLTITAPSDVYASSVNSSPFKIGGTDDYSNTIALGDVLVFDVLLLATQPKANQTGTVDLTVRFSAFIQ